MKLLFRLSMVGASATALVVFTTSAASAFSYAWSDPAYDTYVTGPVTTAEKASADIRAVSLYSDATYIYIKVNVRNLYPAEGQQIKVQLRNKDKYGNYNSLDYKNIYVRYYTDGTKTANLNGDSTSSWRPYVTRSDADNFTRIRLLRSAIGYEPDYINVRTTVFHTGGFVEDTQGARF